MKKIASVVVATYLLSLGGAAFAQSQNDNESAAGAAKKKAAVQLQQGGVVGAAGTQAGGLLPFAFAPLVAVFGTAVAGVAAVAGSADTTTQHSGNR